IRFQDGKIWVARLRLPAPCKGDERASRMIESVRVCFESLSYLRNETPISVPEVYHCDASLDNTVGVPYILMDYIHGTTAKALQEARRRQDYTFGTPIQDAYFRKQLALVQVALATKKFHQIGRPRPDDNGDFKIGAMETDLKFASHSEYYDHVTKKAIQDAASKAPADSQDVTILVPIIFKSLIPRWSIHSGPFGMTHTGLGAHNVLVNERFEILALIDPEGLMAAPIEIQAQLPYFLGLQMEPPGFVANSPMEELKMHLAMTRVKEYRTMLKEADKEINPAWSPVSGIPLWRAVMSPSAVLVQGMLEYRYFGENLDDKWLATFSNMAREGQCLAPEVLRGFPVYHVLKDSEDEEDSQFTL
ncbi:hypothetical protein FQN49_008965, partial [Arthroderma sp. PD_2]